MSWPLSKLYNPNPDKHKSTIPTCVFMHEENGKKEKNGSSWCMCLESENDTLTFLTDFLQFSYIQL